jgi:hypothetical protein
MARFRADERELTRSRVRFDGHGPGRLGRRIVRPRRQLAVIVSALAGVVPSDARVRSGVAGRGVSVGGRARDVNELAVLGADGVLYQGVVQRRPELRPSELEQHEPRQKAEPDAA